MTTTAARRQGAPGRALKSPLAVPGVSDATASGPHNAVVPAPCRTALSDREATLAEFQGYLRTVNGTGALSRKRPSPSTALR